MKGPAPAVTVLVSLLAACGDRAPAPPSPAGSPPREEMARQYLRLMKAIDLQYENLQADLAEGKPENEARARLASIRAAAERASRLPYRAAEAENRDLAFQFATFLDALDRLERAPWAGAEGLRSWRTLGTACAVCHNLYRKD
jgi:cytochrome c556